MGGLWLHVRVVDRALCRMRRVYGDARVSPRLRPEGQDAFPACAVAALGPVCRISLWPSRAAVVSAFSGCA
eukprot:11927822-Alexandrium_andersonii.AAC.1